MTRPPPSAPAARTRGRGCVPRLRVCGAGFRSGRATPGAAGSWERAGPARWRTRAGATGPKARGLSERGRELHGEREGPGVGRGLSEERNWEQASGAGSGPDSNRRPSEATFTVFLFSVFRVNWPPTPRQSPEASRTPPAPDVSPEARGPGEPSRRERARASALRRENGPYSGSHNGTPCCGTRGAPSPTPRSLHPPVAAGPREDSQRGVSVHSRGWESAEHRRPRGPLAAVDRAPTPLGGPPDFGERRGGEVSGQGGWGARRLLDTGRPRLTSGP